METDRGEHCVFQDWESFGGGGGGSDASPPADAPFVRSGAVREAVRHWAELQAGQRILVATPSVVVGYRAQVGATLSNSILIVSFLQVCHQ